MMGMCAPMPECRPAGEALREGRRLLRAHLRRPQRERRRDLPAARRLPRRRRDLRVRRRLLQRPLHRHAGRRHALSGAARLPAGAPRCAWTTRNAAPAAARRPPTARTAACARPAASREQERCASDARLLLGRVQAPGPRASAAARSRPREVADRCRVIGELCMKADECCAGRDLPRRRAAGASRCLPAGGGCAAVGYPCAVAEQCCGGRCLPDGAGALRLPRRLRAASAPAAWRPRTAAADRASARRARPCASPSRTARRAAVHRRRRILPGDVRALLRRDRVRAGCGRRPGVRRVDLAVAGT